MTAHNARDRIVEICRGYVAQWRRSIELMKKGSMSTGGIKNGVRVDTTADTIAELSAKIIELEATITKIEAD